MFWQIIRNAVIPWQICFFFNIIRNIYLLNVLQYFRQYIFKFILWALFTLIDDADNENCNCGTKFGEKYESILRHPTKLL